MYPFRTFVDKHNHLTYGNRSIQQILVISLIYFSVDFRRLWVGSPVPSRDWVPSNLGGNTLSLYDFIQSNTEKRGGSRARLCYESVHKLTEFPSPFY